MANELSRRTFLSFTASAVGVAALGGLTGCGGGTPQKTGANSDALKAALPGYFPSDAAKPDIASVAGGPDALTDPGFLTYPANRVATVEGIPGRGGRYTAVTPLWGTVPPADNAFYQAMHQALGVTLEMKPADGNNYNTIIPTMTASKRLPDWIQLPAWWNSNFSVGELAGSQLADLTPFLAGDKIKKYPNLAALPTGAWQAGAWSDKIYGIPSFSTGFSVSGMNYFRRDVFEAKGIRPDEIRSAQDLMNLGKELTDAKAGVWAFDDVWTYLSPAWGVPNKWKLVDGRLVHKYELPEFLEALEWHHQLATSGYLHPDAIAGDNANGNVRFYAGKVLIAGTGTGQWNLGDHQSGRAANPDFRRGAFDYITADGKGEPVMEMGPATSFVSYLNANLKPEQIEELLAVANYLAAPYGSVEYTLVTYGVEGVHHTMVDGQPTPTDQGKKEVQAQTFPFLGSPTQVISNPGADLVTRDYAAWQAANVKCLRKPMFWAMNLTMPRSLAIADAAQAVEDSIKDCYHGKKKVSEVRDAIASWKSGGGDKLTQWTDENVLQKYGTGQ